MKHIYLLLLVFGLLGCKNSTEQTTQETPISSVSPEEKDNRILFIVSNQHTYGKSTINAANHFAEIVFAYDVFIKAGYAIDFVSPKGGAIPIGYLNTSDALEKQYLYDFEFMGQLKNTFTPQQIDPSKYKAVYYGGGGAAMYGVPENKAIQKIAMAIYEENNGIISAICHGTAGIVHLKTKDGKFLYQGKKVNGFPNLFENMEAAYYQEFPFSIEQTIQNRGGDFSFSEEGWDNYFVLDGRLITGQDPTAAASVAENVVKTLKSQTK
ncbi:type 1 glutamine amidotransferase domain-containing protein [Flagellimonas sp. S174]|uniref:type 1 glutamine amidotransferase domain-containing protein n=1 Tax=Flagellimonas sp. S174 TaxID=3410790 RepID=UPI003BF54029